MTKETTPSLLTSRDAAAWLKISERTLWKLALSGQLRSVRFGRSVRYDMGDLVAFVASRKTSATAAEKLGS